MPNSLPARTTGASKRYREALSGLGSRQVREIQLVSVSTTLATNAIVENDGQKVGLLLMPPPGFDEHQESIHAPQAVLTARLDITGKELAAPDDAQIRRIARRMCDDQGVEAFAVSGYAGSINPDHELAVKRVLLSETGRFVSCGHEMSQLLNFKMRAQTAVYNARIVPRLTRLLKDVAAVLEQTGIRASVMVVRGDGTLMSQHLAMQRPVETILSGPAASVAGARHLTGLDDAVVIDMGGTTTDIAALENGRVRLCESGSHVGSCAPTSGPWIFKPPAWAETASFCSGPVRGRSVPDAWRPWPGSAAMGMISIPPLITYPPTDEGWAAAPKPRRCSP